MFTSINTAELIEIACNIFTALGTVGAVIVALWLSLKSDEKFASSMFLRKKKFIGEDKEKISTTVEIMLTNQGDKNTVIRSVAIKVKHNRVLFFSNQHKFPIKLTSGDIHCIELNLEDFKKSVLEAISYNRILNKLSIEIALYFLRIVVISSTGKRHFFSIDDHVRSALLQA